MYSTGAGVDQNNATAYDLLKKSAEKKSPIGYAGLGSLYYHGQGVERNYDLARKVSYASDLALVPCNFGGSDRSQCSFVFC